MTSSRLMHWILCCLVVAVGVAGCATDTTSSETSGSLSLNLEVGSVDIDEVDFLITGDGMDPVGGTIDTSAPGATASVEVFGLLPGDYTVTLSATATDGETMCEGSEHFSVEADELTEVMVYLRCKLPETLGGVRVNGEFNVCAVVNQSVVKPLQTSVGNDIDLSAMGEDAEGDNITYIWSGTGGDIDDPNAMNTTYTCEEVGEHSVTIRVSDDGFEYCIDSWTTVVTCVEGDGNLCDAIVCVPDGNECTETNCDPSDGICKSENVDDGTDCNGDAGMCMDGECVDKDQCQDVDCDDGEECTDDSCNPLNGECINTPVDDGTDCGDGAAGMCVDGECMPKDLCDGVTCDDTGNECTVGVCNVQTGVCDPMDVEPGTPCKDGAGACAGGECLDNNLCDTVDCTSSNDCMQDGTCNPLNGECIPGDDEPLGTPCADGVCDGQGTCVGCNVPDDCTGDLGQCEAKACIDDACSIVIIMDGASCDLVGTGDGICDAGTCVEAPQCVSPGDCIDGNPCTVGSCPDGMCVFTPVDGGTCDVSTGVPGICSGGGCVGLCVGEDCTSSSQCVMDGTCDDQTGECIPGGNEPADTACTEGGGSVCDGAGNCVECNSADQCTADGNECTAASCVDGACGQTDVADGTSCDGGSGECQSGVCEPLGPPTFDLAGEFRAYNSLLKPEGDPVTCVGAPAIPNLSVGGPVPPGPPVGTCTDPDLTTVPGSTTGAGVGIDTQCVSTQGIGGTLTFDDSGSPIAMTGSFELDFAIDATVDLSAPDCTTILNVVIATSSVNAVSGSGTGSVSDGGSVTLTDPGDGFNVDYTATGTVNCAGAPSTFAATVCTLAGGLAVGDNPLPLPGDPGRRFWPVITFQDVAPADGKLEMQYATGPTTTAGWAMNNPPNLNGPGTQFIATTGVQQ